jgi:glycosyltransferase involved in cell wall biosynthesis
LVSDRPTALVLSPEAPYPLAGGGALRTASLIHGLARTHTVDLIVFREPGAPDPLIALPAGLVRTAHVIPLRPHARHFPARAWRNLGRFARGAPPLNDRFAGYESLIRRALRGVYDVAVVEHFWCAPYAVLLRPHCLRLVLDMHNLESALHLGSAAAAGGLESVLHRRFGAALTALERAWLPAYDVVLAASAADAGAITRISHACHPFVYPNAIPFHPLPAAAHEPTLVFSGNFQYYPNRTGAEFFYRKVWPLVAARWPDLRLRMVGRNPGAVQAMMQHANIEFTGPVDDAIAEIGRCSIAVVPLLSGSGTRVKILEAWAAGVPVVSTSIGAEGLVSRSGETLLLADTPATFAGAIDGLIETPELRRSLAAAGRRLYELEYTWEAAWKRLDAALG